MKFVTTQRGGGIGPSSTAGKRILSTVVVLFVIGVGVGLITGVIG